MHVISVTQSEIRITLEATFDMANALAGGKLDSRAHLDQAGFPRAAKASAAAIARLERRLGDLVPLLRDLPHLDRAHAAARLNEELTELPIVPSIADHDDVGAHIHWTPATETFDTQVIADIVMALVQELCDNGTARFGQCDAAGCANLFYDSTRNRSRRFCSDPRCASRTHTADHRARHAKI